MDKRKPHTSYGVFKPVGHVVISFPGADEMSATQRDLRALGVDEHAMTTYTAQEMTRQAEADLERASGAAAVGQDLNLVKAQLELARLGYHFLVVEAGDKLARRVAELASRHRAERAQLYGHFIVEELIEHPDDQRAVADTPDRGLDAQTPSGREAERAMRHR